MIDFINATIRASCEIASILKGRDSKLYEAKSRGAGGDISIGADLLSEEVFIKNLSKFGNIDSEECGFIELGKPYTIVIDPLDGSDNFASKIPYFGASIALKNAINGEVLIGIIVNYCTNEAIVGFGNLESSENLNNLAESCDDFAADFTLDSAIKSSFQATQNLSGQIFRGDISHDFSKFQLAIFETKIPKCGIFERAYKYPKICEILNNNGLKFRSPGAFALSLSLANEVSFVLSFGKQRHYDNLAGEPLTRNLYKFENENCILISKDKKLFDKILNLFKENLWH